MELGRLDQVTGPASGQYTLPLIRDPVKATLSEPVGPPFLCPRCRGVDFDHAFGHFAKWERPRQRLILEIASAADLLLNPACALCRLLSSARGFDSRIDGRCSYQLLAAHNAECVSYFDHRGDPPKGPVWLAVVPVAEGWHRGGMLPSTFWGEQIEVDFLAEYRPLEPDETAPPIRGVDPESVDFAAVGHWVDLCRSEHDATCATTQAVLPGLVVIDCETRELLPAAPDCAYAALSYVWGASPQGGGGALVEHGRLPAVGSLPLTIEDALSVTRRLGLRHLWVDRYCIPESDKARQIAAMDRVYEAARVTIIAAAGENPEYGLPGVSTRKRTPQEPVRIGSRLLVRTLVNPTQHIKDSKWSTRGWTYQEGHLSRRRLVFTDTQAYFQCKSQNHAFCEALDSLELEQHLRYYGPGTAILAPKLCFRENPPWVGVSEFAARQLGWPSDVLNAMLGILHKWQDGGVRRFRHVGGLPVTKATNLPPGSQLWGTCFLQSLCWKVGRPARRREGFPSWSWTGWASFEGIRLGSIPAIEGSHAFPAVQVELDSGVLLGESPLEKAFEDRDPSLDTARFLRLNVLVVPLRIVPRKSSTSGFSAPADTLSNPDWMVEIGTDGQGDTYDFQLNLVVSDGESTSNESLAHAFSSGFECKGILMAPGRDTKKDRSEASGNLSDEESLPFVKYPKYREVIVVRDLGKWYERIGFFCIYYSSVKTSTLHVKSIRLG